MSLPMFETKSGNDETLFLMAWNCLYFESTAFGNDQIQLHVFKISQVLL